MVTSGFSPFVMEEDGFAYVKVKQVPIESMSQRSVQMNFSSTAFLTQFYSLAVGLNDVKGYFSGDLWPKFGKLAPEDSKVTFLDWPVKELDEVPFTRLKSLMVIESKLEEVPDICAQLGGSLPTPRYGVGPDQTFFSKVLTKLGVTKVLISYTINHGSYVYPDGKVLNVNPNVQTLSSSSSDQTLVGYDEIIKANFVKHATLSKDFLILSEPRGSDVLVSKNLCMIPRSSHLGAANNEHASRKRFVVLSDKVSDLASVLKGFHTQFERSNFGRVKSSSSDQSPLPFWMVSASEVLTMLKSYKARLDDKLPFDLLTQMIQQISSEAASSTEFLSQQMIQLENALCQTNSSLTLDCVERDNSRSWARLDFVPTTSSTGYQLSFSNVVFEVHRASWIGCFTQTTQGAFMLLPDTCCKLLSSNDGHAISECPSLALNTGYLGARVGQLLHSISSHDRVLQRCQRAVIDEIGDDSFLPLTKCNLQFLRKGFLATILNKIGATAQAILPFNGERSYSEKDKTKFLIWGLIAGSGCLCL